MQSLRVHHLRVSKLRGLGLKTGASLVIRIHLMEFMILNRGQAPIIAKDIRVPHLFLSVREPNKVEVTLPANPDRLLLHRMVFTDEDNYEQACRLGQVDLLMTDAQADTLVNLVMANSKKAKLIVCQCDGGMSRSAGMAAAFTLIFNGRGEDTGIFRKKCPNMWVYRKILNAFTRYLEKSEGV